MRKIIWRSVYFWYGLSVYFWYRLSVYFWYRLSVYCPSNFPGLYLCLFRCLYLALRSASKWARTQTILTEKMCIFNDLRLSPTGPIHWAGSALLAVIFQIPTVIRLVRSVVSGSWRCGPVFAINWMSVGWKHTVVYVVQKKERHLHTTLKHVTSFDENKYPMTILSMTKVPPYPAVYTYPATSAMVASKPDARAFTGNKIVYY